MNSTPINVAPWIEVEPIPTRVGPGHRRSHSDTSFRFYTSGDDDRDFFDIEDINLSALDLAPCSPQHGLPLAVNSSRSDEFSGDNRNFSTSSRAHQDFHARSLSVDAEFLEGLSFTGGDGVGGESKVGGDGGERERKVAMHRRTSSMDGSSSSCSMIFGVGDREISVMDGVKKAMPPEKLAELALIDPKRAKRILANRQSAVRSKERKVRYTSELERKVHTLQTEATTLSAQVTMLQRDTSGLTVENKELLLRLQALEQQAQLRDALNEALRHDVQRLRIATGQIPPSNGNSSARGLFSQFPTNAQNAHPFGDEQNHQHHSNDRSNCLVSQRPATSLVFQHS